MLIRMMVEFGTTCIAAVVNNNQLLVASVGDSKCVIARQLPKDKIKADILSVTHNSANKDEGRYFCL